MYLLFVADFDENDSSVIEVDLEDLNEYFGDPEFVDRLLVDGLFEGEWHNYHLVEIGVKEWKLRRKKSLRVLIQGYCFWIQNLMYKLIALFKVVHHLFYLSGTLMSWDWVWQFLIQHWGMLIFALEQERLMRLKT